ncbi:MAG: NifB/NifX family molybdenum-iron cluster-binding protein [Anaerolineae bacterium]
MRVAISADENSGLASTVNPHFGRCPFFVFVDLNGRVVTNVEVRPNPYYGQHQPGQVPAFIRAQGADVMLTGGMGARAVAFFQECGIEPITGADGTVGEALSDYLSGRLRGAGACSESIEHGH